MGNEQFKALMNGFNSLNKYVRLLSVRRGPHHNEARSFKEKMNARYEAFKAAVIADTRLEKVDNCLTSVDTTLFKIVDRVL
jgi:hypothetical protein